jgi:peptidoglycan/xylan/chitin deacetylase (PgdA/CDA1 family)
MVTVTREGLDRVSAERRARWLQQRRRRRVFWLIVAALIVAATAFALWPSGSGHHVAEPIAPTRHVAVRPAHAAAKPELSSNISRLLAGLPLSDAVVHGDPSRRMVALTFDDGPSGRTPAILRVLANHGAHATFFVVGRATRGMEPTLRHIVANGNEVGDHTYSHANLLSLKRAKRSEELRWTIALVQDATHVKPRFFRPPDGATGPAVNRLGRSLGLVPVLWSVDSRDWSVPGTKAIVKKVLRDVKPGSIVLLHDGGGDRQETLRALPAILRALERRHLQPVTLSQLLSHVPPLTAFESGSLAGSKS